MLFDQDPRGECLNRVIVEQRHGGLQDDRTVVQLGGHEMHGGARDSHAMVERLPLRVESGECRQEGGVDVQNAVREGLDQRGTHQAHETGQADQIDASGAEQIDQRAVVGVAVRIVARVEVDRLDARVTCAAEARGVVAVGDHHGNRRVEPAVTNGVDDRLHVRAAAGDQDGQPRKKGSGVVFWGHHICL